MAHYQKRMLKNDSEINVLPLYQILFLRLALFLYLHVASHQNLPIALYLTHVRSFSFDFGSYLELQKLLESIYPMELELQELEQEQLVQVLIILELLAQVLLVFTQELEFVHELEMALVLVQELEFIQLIPKQHVKDYQLNQQCLHNEIEIDQLM